LQSGSLQLEHQQDGMFHLQLPISARVTSFFRFTYIRFLHHLSVFGYISRRWNRLSTELQ